MSDLALRSPTLPGQRPSQLPNGATISPSDGWLFLAVLAVSLASTPLVIRVLRRYAVVDRPNHRSSHSGVTVRGAGLAVAAAVLAGTFVVDQPRLLVAWVLAAAAGTVGLVDDVRGLPIRIRLGAQLLLGGVAVLAATGSTWAPAVLGVVFFVGYLNAFNFMDGINGISSLHAAGVAAVWLLADAVTGAPLTNSSVHAGAVVLGAACLGFLPFNIPTARAFLGDVGSYFLGAFVALLALWTYEVHGLLIALAPLTVYIADTTYTLARRMGAGQRIGVPHRDHVYQRLVRGGWAHVSSSLTVLGVTVLTGAIGVIGVRMEGQALASTAILLCLSGYLALPELLFDPPPGIETQESIA